MTTIRKKILIVEDDGIIALDLREKLEQAGYHVPIIATNSREAIDAVASDLPDLILMDIRLSGPDDGIGTAEKIRKAYQLPIIFVTAHADSETLDRAKVTEPFGYIVKPLGGVNFHAQIEMALRKHSMEQRLKASEAWLSTAFRNVADASITTDAQGNIVLMSDSAESLTGWSIDEVTGRSLVEVFDVREATGLPVVDALNHAVYHDEKTNLGASAFVLYSKYEVRLLVEGKMSPSRDSVGALLGMVFVFRDISGRPKTEEQARVFNQMIEAFSLPTTSLTAVSAESYGHIGKPAPNPILETEGYTCGVLEDLGYLVMQVAALGRPPQAAPTVVELNAAISSLEIPFRSVLGNSRTLTVALQSDMPPIEVDIEELKKTLLRVIIEARISMPGSGSMDVRTETAFDPDGTRRAQLAIGFRGHGVRSSPRVKIFDSQPRSRFGGRNSEMSFALVRQFVTLNGGFIEIKVSHDETRETNFLFSFPSATDPHVALTVQ